MKWILLCAGLLVTAPAAAQQPSSLYEQGVSARLAGDTDRAVDLLGRAAAAEPANADARLQLGLALLAAERLDEAESAFRMTLSLAPDYPDARLGLARIAQRRGDRAGALAALAPLDAANAEAAALRHSLETADAAPKPLQLDLDLSYSNLEAGRPDWREAMLQLRIQAEPSLALRGAGQVSSRFGLTDVYGELGADVKVGPASTLYATLGATADADFLPEVQLSAGGTLKVREGRNPSVLTLDGRYAHYRSGDVKTISPGLEQYLAGGKVWLTARWINIFDEQGDHQSGWLLRGDVQAQQRLRLFAGAADAADTSAGIVIDTFSLFGGAVIDLSNRYVLRVSVAHEDRETGADRLQLAVGMGARF